MRFNSAKDVEKVFSCVETELRPTVETTFIRKNSIENVFFNVC